jgi:hypothetical protein
LEERKKIFKTILKKSSKRKPPIFTDFFRQTDESIDASYTAQFAVFVRGTDSEFHVPKELAGLMALKGTNTGEDLHEKVKKMLQKLNIQIQKLVGLLTDGAPSMAGRNSGFPSLITKM